MFNNIGSLVFKINKIILRYLRYLVICFLVSSCMSMGNYQTAEVQPSGGEAGISFSNALINSNLYTYTSNPDRYNRKYFTTINIFARVVLIGELWDIGAKMSLTSVFGFGLGVGVDTKLQFLNSDAVDMAIGFGFFYNYYGADASAMALPALSYWDLAPVLLTTFHIGEYFHPTIALKTITRINKLNDNDWSYSNYSSTETLIGGVFTLAIGKRLLIMPEFGYFRDLNNRSYYHVGLGALYRFRFL